MALTDLLPVLAALAAAGFMLHRATTDGAPRRNGWMAPAALALAFLGWSLAAAAIEGPFGFWPEHVRNLWGNQIWFDLLLAVATALAFILPKARALGMRTLPWTLLVLATGSIGLLALVARMLFLAERRSAAPR